MLIEPTRTNLRYVQQSITDRLRELVHCRCKSYLLDHYRGVAELEDAR